MSAFRLFGVAFTATFLIIHPAIGQSFEVSGQLPSPAPGSFVVVGTNLPDGRFILWNGDGVFIQSGTGGGLVPQAATGYVGDPGFIAMSPDGQTALLGPGFSPRVYLFDTQDPENYSPAAEIVAPTHFSGAFLTEDLVLLDRGKDDFSGSELVILDLNSPKSAPSITVVVKKPAAAQINAVIVDKPPFSFSSSLRVDPTGTTLYAMDANTRELRTFAVADILDAHAMTTPLDWTLDGTLIGSAGQYYTGGVAGFTALGELVIGGSEGFGLPGGIQIVDPITGTILDTLDPAGNQDFYDVIFNQVTFEMLARSGSGVSFATVNALAEVPAAGLPVLLAMGMALIAIGWMRLARSRYGATSRGLSR